MLPFDPDQGFWNLIQMPLDLTRLALRPGSIKPFHARGTGLPCNKGFSQLCFCVRGWPAGRHRAPKYLGLIGFGALDCFLPCLSNTLGARADGQTRTLWPTSWTNFLAEARLSAAASFVSAVDKPRFPTHGSAKVFATLVRTTAVLLQP